MFYNIVVVFVIPADKWIRKLWYIYTMEYYSATKKNSFESVLMRWMKLSSFRMDWLDLPAVQGTLKSLLQDHNSKASVLWCSAFFVVQLSHPYMTT